ncbi:MAG TPA: gluconolactonase [Firmicutes bacterium]|jgi:gluconolactonase|nr:gluconolactonase [Bacillota bacterium]
MFKYAKKLICICINLVLLFSINSAMAAEVSGNITVSGEQLKVIYNQGTHLEGPAAALDGKLYFCDLTPSGSSKGTVYGGHILQYDPATGNTIVFRSPSGQADGLSFDLKGRLLAAESADNGGRRITATDMATGQASILVNRVNGHPFNSPNDLTIDAKGRIYFTDPRYFGSESMEQPVQGVYRIDSDGTVKLIIANAGKPNGIAISPDQKTLYVGSNDNGLFDQTTATSGLEARRGLDGILAYDLKEDGTVKLRKMIVQEPDFRPDGMRTDSNGNIFVANFSLKRPGILVFSPNGTELGIIPTPELVTNCEFGTGKDSNVLYITGLKSLYKITTTHYGCKKFHE